MAYYRIIILYHFTISRPWTADGGLPPTKSLRYAGKAVSLRVSQGDGQPSISIKTHEHVSPR